MKPRITLFLLLAVCSTASALDSATPRVRVELPVNFIDLDANTLKTIPSENHYGQDVVLTDDIKARGLWPLAEMVSEGHRTKLHFLWIAKLYRYDSSAGRYQKIASCRMPKGKPNILEQAQNGDLVAFGCDTNCY